MRRLFRLWRLAGTDLQLILQVARRADRPRWLIPALVLLGVFAFEPLNFAMPLVGAVDDMVLLPLLLRGLARLALRESSRLRKEDDRVVSVQ